MKWTVEDVLREVEECEDDKKDFRGMAEAAQKAWELIAFENRTWRQAIEIDGQEQITLPQPFNDVALATRLLADIPAIEVPCGGSTQDDEERASKRERWLAAAWQRVYTQQRMNVLDQLKWQSFVRGCFAFQVVWIKDVLPAALKKRMFPFLIRPLDPLNVGVYQNQLYTEYAYHKYRTEWRDVKSRYGNLDRRKAFQKDYKEDSEVEVVDFWYTDHSTGDIHNCVVVDDQFAKKPTKMDYKYIPIVSGFGDVSNYQDSRVARISLLHPMIDLWKYQCRLASQMGTGLLYYFWPYTWAENENGLEIPDIKVRPGKTETLPAGTRLNTLATNPNVPLAQAMQGQIGAALQQSTFPQVMYGDAGNMQAGFGVQILSSSARGRINSFRSNLEMGIQLGNEILLSCTEEFGGSKGVPVWGKDMASDETYSLTLHPDDIAGEYDNLVRIEVQVPQDLNAKQTIGMRMVGERLLSPTTFRDRFVGEPLPPNEQQRIDYHWAMQDPALAQKRNLRTIQSMYPDTWTEIIAGTPLEEMAIKLGEAHKMPDGTLMVGKGMEPPAPSGMPPMGNMPPMPPPQGAQPVQPPGMPMPMGGGLSPEQQGQLTPQALGMPPAMLNDPTIFQQMMGNPMSPADELRALGGQ